MVVGDIEQLYSSIECNEAHVCEPGTTGYTALFGAAVGNHSDCLRVLMDAHADVNQRSPNGLDPLTAAARAGHHQIVTMLLESSACDLVSTVPRSDHTSALMEAAANGYNLIVSHLLQANALPAQADSKGSSVS